MLDDAMFVRKTILAVLPVLLKLVHFYFLPCFGASTASSGVMTAFREIAEVAERSATKNHDHCTRTMNKPKQADSAATALEGAAAQLAN
jgi:hypothetical protein